MITRRQRFGWMALVLMVPFMLMDFAMAAKVEPPKAPPIKEINWDDLMPPVDDEIVVNMRRVKLLRSRPLIYC